MKGFISYAHQNTAMFNRFNKFLKRPLALLPGVEVWTDTDNQTGHAFERRILDRITAADFFVLLVSTDFLASDFIWDIEIPAIKQRYQSGALVLPVVLLPCQWEQVTGTRLASPRNKDSQLVPVAKWTLREEGYDCAAKQVMASIRGHFNLTPNQTGVFT